MWQAGPAPKTTPAPQPPTPSICLPAAHSASVKYEQDCHALTLTYSGQGTPPTSTPALSPGCPFREYHAGEQITLTADPDDNWYVGSWTGTNNDASTSETNTVTMPAAAHTVNVNYTQDCHTLTLAYTGMGVRPSSTPMLSPGCPIGKYRPGQAIQLTARPAPTWHVAGWTGTDDDASTSETNALTMPNNDHTATVHCLRSILHITRST